MSRSRHPSSNDPERPNPDLGRPHVPIIGVGQLDGWNQVLEAFDQAVAHTRIHQGARFFQSGWIKLGTLLEQVANPLVVDGI